MHYVMHLLRYPLEVSRWYPNLCLVNRVGNVHYLEAHVDGTGRKVGGMMIGMRKVVKAKSVVSMMKKNFLRRRSLSRAQSDTHQVARKRSSLHPKEEEFAVFRCPRCILASIFQNFTSACVLARGFRFDFAHITLVESHLHTACWFACSQLKLAGGCLVYLSRMSRLSVPSLLRFCLFSFPCQSPIIRPQLVVMGTPTLSYIAFA